MVRIKESYQFDFGSGPGILTRRPVDVVENPRVEHGGWIIFALLVALALLKVSRLLHISALHLDDDDELQKCAQVQICPSTASCEEHASRPDRPASAYSNSECYFVSDRESTRRFGC